MFDMFFWGHLVLALTSGSFDEIDWTCFIRVFHADSIACSGAGISPSSIKRPPQWEGEHQKSSLLKLSGLVWLVVQAKYPKWSPCGLQKCQLKPQPKPRWLLVDSWETWLMWSYSDLQLSAGLPLSSVLVCIVWIVCSCAISVCWCSIHFHPTYDDPKDLSNVFWNHQVG